MQRVEDWDYDFPPLSAGALPTERVRHRAELKLNGTTLALKYYGPAHTDSDISVRFVEADILHTGDTYWNGIYPFIDYSTGGSIDGSIRAAEANLAADDATRPSSSRATGRRSATGPGSRNSATCWSPSATNVAALKQQGRSLDEIVAARPTAAYDAKWGQFVIEPGPVHPAGLRGRLIPSTLAMTWLQSSAGQEAN